MATVVAVVVVAVVVVVLSARATPKFQCDCFCTCLKNSIYCLYLLLPASLLCFDLTVTALSARLYGVSRPAVYYCMCLLGTSDLFLQVETAVRRAACE